MRAFLVLIAAVAIAFPATADEKPVQLKPAPGLDKVEGTWRLPKAKTPTRKRAKPAAKKKRSKRGR